MTKNKYYSYIVAFKQSLAEGDLPLEILNEILDTGRADTVLQYCRAGKRYNATEHVALLAVILTTQYDATNGQFYLPTTRDCFRNLNYAEKCLKGKYSPEVIVWRK